MIKFNNDGKFAIRIKFTHSSPKEIFNGLILGAVFGLIIITIMPKLMNFLRADILTVSQCSMNPTLYQGDKLYIKTANVFNCPHRGDIMIFIKPYDTLTILKPLTESSGEGLLLVKRVIGLPGEEINIKPAENNRSTVYINGKKLNEKYILTNPNDFISHMVYEPYVIPKDSYFMMGDNRDESLDSRYFGPIKKEAFIGRVACVFYPFNRIKRL